MTGSKPADRAVSGTASHDQPVPDGRPGFPDQGSVPPAPAPALTPALTTVPSPGGRRRHRGRWVALGIVVVVAAGSVAAWRAGVFSPAASSGAGRQAPPPATATVKREDLSAAVPVAATLGYAGSYPVAGQGGGTLTWLPSPGRVVAQGQALYQTGNGSPVALLYGSVPDWRALADEPTGNLDSATGAAILALGCPELPGQSSTQALWTV